MMDLKLNQMTYSIGLDCYIFILLLVLIVGWIGTKYYSYYMEYRSFNNKVASKVQEEKKQYISAKDLYSQKKAELDNLDLIKINKEKARSVLDEITECEVTFEFIKNKLMTD